MTTNYLLKISFDGRQYHGWQVQKDAKTIMGTFQEILENVINEKVDIKGCSRTDSGVSAKCYCLSFKTNSSIPPKGLMFSLNNKLPNTIKVISCKKVSDNFHARYNVSKKEYVYTILNDSVMDPITYGYYYMFPDKINLNRLKENAKDYIGTYDYSAFKNVGNETEDNIRTIYSFNVSKKGKYIIFKVSGNGFLYNMVRIMVGTLLDIERGNIKDKSIKNIIMSKDRKLAGFTAPASGLMLNKVIY